MNKIDTIIEYSEIELRRIIHKLVNGNHEHSKTIANCIFEEFTKTEIGFKNLVLATQGVSITLEDLNLEIGMNVVISVDHMATWRMNIDKMKDAQIILNNTIGCCIKEYDRTKNYPILITYKCIDDDDNESVKEDWMLTKYIKHSIL